MNTNTQHDKSCASLRGMGKHAVVVIDPPWPTVGRHGGAGPEYYQHDLMSLKDIAAMPIPDVLADDAFVLLWVINTHMPHAYDMLKAWDLRYLFTMVWDKGHGGKPAGYPTYNAEHIVVGAKGKPKFIDTKAFKLVNQWPRRAHSEKPKEFYELLCRVTDGPRLDVFNRCRINGFDGWGSEAPCEEHDWVIPRSTGDLFVFGICSICGEVEEFVNAMQSLPTNGG